MGSGQRSPPALRTIIVGTIGGAFDFGDPSDSLLRLGTAELPDGAEAYVKSLKAVYRLNKSSTGPFEDGGTIIAAVNGGFWEYVSSPSGFLSAAFGGTAFLGGPQVVTQLVWVALPSGDGFYDGASANNSALRLNTTTGIVTYNGPDGGTFLVQAIASLNCANADELMWLTITKNAFLLTPPHTTDFDISAGVSASPSTPAADLSISTGKILTFATGDTFQVVMRNSHDTPGSLECTHLNLIVTPA